MEDKYFIEKLKKKKQIELYDKCLEKWGLLSQILMLAEESSELTQASLGLNRESKSETAINHLAEEIADTELMIDEIKYYFNEYQLEGWVQDWKDRKIIRLKERLDK